ncbi:aldo/keto reductase [Isoptericola sp. b441]|uniref:Aldo/keto reductase n=1 Tax=Actinotalea lenta TaxID=3064654 RepID=A0ABT9D6I7_9CELL|nr:aldo/keto reductase [Isoptericola sp. b441]MDO8106455.1 aldo/keto reductase [Isoptericola sp. b441]
MPYRRCGRSGLSLPSLSLGLWHNFGAGRPYEVQRAVLRRAFDLGVTHLDLANNYGPPYGSAEETFGRVLAADLRPYRDELVISTKAGYDMWPGPYGDGGSRKYLLASLDQSLTRMGLDYVDIFYSHRPDPTTPLEETVGALLTAVHSGRALYVGISNYSPSATRRAAQMLAAEGVRLLVHQPRYSMLDRYVEQPPEGESESLLEVVDELGVGVAVFSPLAQGLLTDRYLAGEVPADSRAATSRFLSDAQITPEYLAMVRGLARVAEARGQSVAQLALSWVLRDPRVTTAIIGASSVAQLEDNVAALQASPLSDSELAEVEALLAAG